MQKYLLLGSELPDTAKKNLNEIYVKSSGLLINIKSLTNLKLLIDAELEKLVKKSASNRIYRKSFFEI